MEPSDFGCDLIGNPGGVPGSIKPGGKQMQTLKLSRGAISEPTSPHFELP